jgi:hypothetical protein
MVGILASNSIHTLSTRNRIIQKYFSITNAGDQYQTQLSGNKLPYANIETN